MAPRYPFSRNKPSTSESSEAGPSNHSLAAGSGTSGRGIVVSATGRSPANLTADSPTILRSRIISPREGDEDGAGQATTTKSTFQTDPSNYPSPAGYLLRGKTRKKGKGVDRGDSSTGGGGGWMELSEEYTSTREVPAHRGDTMAVPTYDSRGYPITRPGESEIRPLRSVSRGSVLSTTGGGEDDMPMYTRQFMTATPERPSTYLAEGNGETVAGASIYPPVPMSYSTSEISRDPYDPNPVGFGANNPYGQGTGNHNHVAPLPSLYGDSKVSLASMRSEHSTTQFRRYDALQDSYGAFSFNSLSSKGGKRHVEDSVSRRSVVHELLEIRTDWVNSSLYLQIRLSGHTKAQKPTTISMIPTSSLKRRPVSGEPCSQ